MAQRFKAKTLLSNSGVFNNEVIAPNLVYNTGNQTIAGDKTFTSSSVLTVKTISGFKGSSPDSLNLIAANDCPITLGIAPGGDINLRAGTGVTAGISDYGEINLYAAGPKYNGNINLNGNININRLPYLGDLTTIASRTISIGKTGNGISFNALTIDNDNISLDDVSYMGVTGFGLYISGVAVTPAIYVNTTSNQTISGVKTFATGIDIINSGNPQSLRVFNRTGLNTGEFGFFGWNNNQLTIGSQQTNSGILRDVTLTGANININASGVFNIFDTTNISGNLNVTGNIFLSGNSVLTGSNHTHLWSQSTYDAQIGTSNGGFAGRTSVGTLTLHAGSQNTAVPSFYGWDGFTNTSFTAATARTNLELTSTATAVENTFVRTTGNQTISGVKTFATGINISGNVGIGTDSNTFKLYVRKTAAGGVNPDGGSIAVFEGSGNSHITILTPNSQSAGVVFGSPADNFGSYLTWNHDNNALKLGTAKPSGFIQLLTDDEVEAVRITSGAYVGIGTTSPSEKLQVVGNILANNLVYNTGDQTISGVKTFVDSINVSGTGIFNALDLNNIDNLSLSGVDIAITSGNVNIINPNVGTNSANLTVQGSGIFFKGIRIADTQVGTANPAISIYDGANDSYAGITFSDGYFVLADSTNNRSLNYDFSVDANNSAQNIAVDSKVVHNTTNETISGIKTFANNIIYPVSSGVTGIIFTPDASTSTFFDYTLTGNSTLNQPINMNNGQSITLFLTQDASGNRNMSFNSGYLFSNGINPTLNLVPSGTDIMQVIKTRNKLYCTFASNY